MVRHCDLEADDLWYGSTRIWILVSYDDEHDWFDISFDEQEYDQKKPIKWVNIRNCTMYRGHQKHLDILRESSVNFHNYFGYDKWVIRKFYPDWLPKDEQDSLVLSMLFNPDIGGHGLADWGKRVGLDKPDYTDWKGGLTKGMVVRCVDDVRITHLTWKRLFATQQGYDWSKSVWLEYRIADIMGRQANHGVLFDLDKAYDLADWLWCKVHQLGKEIQEGMPYVVKRGTEYKRKPVCGVSFEPPNINSFTQIKNHLLSVGWKPTTYTEKGSPQITEDSFDTIQGELGQKIALRSVLKHRAQMLFNIDKNYQFKGLINLVRPDGRLEAGAMTNGTNTGRMRHRVVVNIPKAKDVKKYDFPYDIRELFIVR